MERLGELQEGERTDNVGSVIAHLQQFVQGAEEYIWLMAHHRLGNQEYVTKSGKLESNSRITCRVILPASSSIDWAEARRTAGIHKDRIEYHPIDDPTDILAGIAMNEKIAGVTFPGAMGKLDFNGGFRGSNPLFRKWCQDLFIIHWNKKGKRVQI